ncbi:MAG: Sec-independent protein translocase protein TatB [Kiloniellaceae bacterium]
MFDIGWSEMAVIALIALIVIGPKDLPRTMKTIAQWMRKARSLTREFQSGIDDMVREAELEDAKKALEATRGGNLKRTLSNAIDPDDEVGGEVRAVEHEARSSGSANPASNAEKAAARIPSPNVAPPHSLNKPEPAPAAAPAAQESGDKAGSTSGGEGSKQTA